MYSSQTNKSETVITEETQTVGLENYVDKGTEEIKGGAGSRLQT